MQISSFSLPGPKGSNDDRLLEPTLFDGGWIGAVADGVGGNAGGARAAEIAVEVLQKSASDSTPLGFEALFHDACSLMAREAQQHPEWAKMATTLSAIRVRNGTAEIGHVGDSRVYHLRGEGIVTRTRDQTELAELIRQNVISPRQAARYPRKHVILSYLSPQDDFDLMTSEFSVEPGDYILLVTDGVYDLIRKSDFVSLKASYPNLYDFTKAVEYSIQNRNIRDDSTLLAIEI